MKNDSGSVAAIIFLLSHHLPVETWKEQEPRRYALEEGIQLVHHNIIGLAGIEGPCNEDVVHDRFWFKPVLEGPVGEGFDAEHVL